MNVIIILFAKYLFLASIIIFIAYLTYLWRNNKNKSILLIRLSAVSFPLILIAAKISGHFIYDPRPFLVTLVKPLIPSATDNGFPSDHTLLTMALASVIFVYNRKLGIVLFSIALLVGTARVLAKVHHPLDIIGSTLIATVITTIVYSLLSLTKKKFQKRL